MMRKRFIAWSALILAGNVAGCSSTNGPAAVNPVDPDSVNLPVKFSGYRSFYTFVAEIEYGGMHLNDKDVLLKLASDSTTTIITTDDKAIQYPHLYLVEPHYLNGGILDQIRGAQGNGHYYVLRPLATNYIELDTDKGFELLGIFAGNSCQFVHDMDKPAFITHWHMSAAESPVTTYEWNGRYFEMLK